ncbi:MAG: hypothetical protein Q8S01_06365, partial [Ignavibacteria bacterium]|nr:hypothetical protein [Ignavibacteria bacterium]
MKDSNIKSKEPDKLFRDKRNFLNEHENFPNEPNTFLNDLNKLANDEGKEVYTQSAIARDSYNVARGS